VPFGRLDFCDTVIEGTGLVQSIPSTSSKRWAAGSAFESTQGKGATFSVDLPLIQETPAATVCRLDACIPSVVELLCNLRPCEAWKRVLLPKRTDHLPPMLSSFSYYESLARTGIKLWRYQPGFLHQKALLVDDELAAIGSFNMDYRSFRLNFELLVMVTDEGSPAR